MSDTPRVTLCIPTYNAERTLADTLRSLQAQTYSGFKALIVDNASTDKTTIIAEEFASVDPRFCVHRHDANIGGEGNFTRCLRLADGDFTAIYHADDVYEAEMVEKQVAAFDEHPNIAAVFTRGLIIDGENHEIKPYPCPADVFNEYNGHLDITSTLSLLVRYTNFFICPSAMVRTAVYRRIDQWERKGFASSSDLDVWLRILQSNTVLVLDEQLIRYRTSAASFSYHYGFLRRKRSDFYRVMDEYVLNASRVHLTDKDLGNYAFLNFKEDIGLAFNALVSGDAESARDHLLAVLTRRHLLAGMREMRWLQYYLLGCSLKLLSLVTLPVWMRRIMIRARYGR